MDEHAVYNLDLRWIFFATFSWLNKKRKKGIYCVQPLILTHFYTKGVAFFTKINIEDNFVGYRDAFHFISQWIVDDECVTCQRKMRLCHCGS